MLAKMFAERTFREKIFLVTVMLLAISMGYFLFRFRPLALEVDAAVREAQRAVGQVNKVSSSGQTQQTPAQLQRQLDRLSKQLADQRSRLAACRSFASLQDDRAVPALNVEISELAQSSGVRIRTRAPFKPPALDPNDPQETVDAQPRLAARGRTSQSPSIANPFLDQSFVYDVCRDSLQRFEVEAPFVNLRQFLEGLSGLAWPVTVVDFQIEALETDEAVLGDQLLSATLILAM
jgi:hypothetical protein